MYGKWWKQTGNKYKGITQKILLQVLIYLLPICMLSDFS